MLEIFGCVLEALTAVKASLFPLLNMQNCSRGVGIERPTEHTEKGKGSLFLSYTRLLDKKISVPKKCSFPVKRVTSN